MTRGACGAISKAWRRSSIKEREDKNTPVVCVHISLPCKQQNIVSPLPQEIWVEDGVPLPACVYQFRQIPLDIIAV